MENCNKRVAKKKGGSDWINQLPDELLIHILSFLTTKEAVKTCSVAKRWSKLWAHVPSLDFDYLSFVPKDFDPDSEDLEYYYDLFEGSVTSVLKSLQVSKLDSFRLVWEHEDEFKIDPFSEWIPRVVELSPRNLYISVRTTLDGVVLPDSIFTCESLEELGLRIEASLGVCFDHTVVKLPRLKRLYLSFMEIDSEVMNDLLLGCPMLEELEFESCILNFSEVSSNTLKSFVVSDCDIWQDIQYPSLVRYGFVTNRE